MEEFVRKILGKYLSFVSEKEMYERWLNMRENKEVREQLAVVEMKVVMIQSWFNLLNSDERFVIERHLIDELEWPRVAFSFTERWKGEFSRAERTLIGYQASGLAKITDFVDRHREMVIPLSLECSVFTDIVYPTEGVLSTQSASTESETSQRTIDIHQLL